MLLAADLDRTLIYSRTAALLTSTDEPVEVAELMIVEHRKGEPASFMTETAAKIIAELPIVPVTTRSLTQYGRVRLPGGPPQYAVAANGGHLLVDGAPDPVWADQVVARLDQVAPLAAALGTLHGVTRPGWRIREVDGLFCYAVLDKAKSALPVLTELRGWAAEHGWTVSLQGRKLYLVPQPLTKSAAVAEIVARTNANTVYAAGDSLLDIDLLEYADAGLHPGHGELAESGWSAPHVRRLIETGALAGQRIAEWFAEALAVTDAALPRPGTRR